MPESKPTVVSIMLNIGDNAGHAFPYNRAVGKAAMRLGWRHMAAVQTGCTVRPLPEDWDICLHPIDFWGSRGPNPFSVLRAAQTIARYLRRRVLPVGRPAILFLEFFSFPHLLALALALLVVPRGDLWVWLLYRYEIHRQPTRRLYRLLSRLLDRLVGPRHQVLSDSGPLAIELAPWLGQVPVVMPIPHAAPQDTPAYPAWARSADRIGKIICWWPGRAAPEKGLDRLRSLAAMNSSAASAMCLVAARSTGLAPLPGGPQVHLVDDSLPAAIYAGWMQAADLVLLPYDAQAYGARTSGIFVEAIVAGTPAAVSAGTWMASEAAALGAGDLIVDWEAPSLVAELVRLATDPDVVRQVKGMQAVYAQRHTEAGYAAALEALFMGG